MQQQRFEADMQTGYGGSADQAAHPAYPSGTTTPVQQPEMSQVDVQFGQGAQPSQAQQAHQAAMLAEQQRQAQLASDMERQREIQRLQQQAKKQPTGHTNIRKLIKSAATRE